MITLKYAFLLVKLEKYGIQKKKPWMVQIVPQG